MEAFFTRVLTAVMKNLMADEKVQALMKDMVKEAVKDATHELTQVVANIPLQIEDLEKNALGNIDSIDGKVGNLQEQLTGIPGQIIEGVLGGFKNVMPNFPDLGGLFGQR